MNILSSISGNTQMPQSTKMLASQSTPALSTPKDSDGDTDGSPASTIKHSKLLDIAA